MIRVNLRDFSKTPGGRDRKSGKFSAEEFREDWLKPKLEEAMSRGCSLRVDLDGTAGLASSFLDGAFTWIALLGFDAIDTLEIVSNEQPSYALEIMQNMQSIFNG